jgi:hypothetical protein
LERMIGGPSRKEDDSDNLVHLVGGLRMTNNVFLLG